MWRCLFFILWLCTACDGGNIYVVEGTVIEVSPPYEVVLAHKEVKGLMPAMTMPFNVRDGDIIKGLEPGHKVLARFRIDQTGGFIERLRVTGKGPTPQQASYGPAPIRTGQEWPEMTIPTGEGESISLGPRQERAIALTFVYTRCPLPDFCPAVMVRMQALQEQIGEEALILAVTLDPEYDTFEVLDTHSKAYGADSNRWKFGRLTGEALEAVVMGAGLSVSKDNGQILHGLRLLILSSDGRLVERYDDNFWSMDRVLTQLKTGEPFALPGADGTLTPQ